MAEFTQTMRDWRRMCESFRSCGECPLGKAEVEGTYMCESGITAFDYEAAEPLILGWAAAHPEPVYPTWKEVLVSLYHDVSDARLLATPIPANIAEILGVEPKEGA